MELLERKVAYHESRYPKISLTCSVLLRKFTTYALLFKGKSQPGLPLKVTFNKGFIMKQLLRRSNIKNKTKVSTEKKKQLLADMTLGYEPRLFCWFILYTVQLRAS